MRRLQIGDPKVAEEGYQDLLTSIERKPFPSLEGLRNIRRLMATQNPKAANVKVEDLIDAGLSASSTRTVTWIKWRRAMG